MRSVIATARMVRATNIRLSLSLHFVWCDFGVCRLHPIMPWPLIDAVLVRRRPGRSFRRGRLLAASSLAIMRRRADVRGLSSGQQYGPARSEEHTSELQ